MTWGRLLRRVLAVGVLVGLSGVWSHADYNPLYAFDEETPTWFQNLVIARGPVAVLAAWVTYRIVRRYYRPDSEVLDRVIAASVSVAALVIAYSAGSAVIGDLNNSSHCPMRAVIGQGYSYSDLPAGAVIVGHDEQEHRCHT